MRGQGRLVFVLPAVEALVARVVHAQFCVFAKVRGLGRRCIVLEEGAPARTATSRDASTCRQGVKGIGPLQARLGCVGEDGHGD